MFARVVCPACQHKFSIPEGDMGKRHVCPNCQSPFVAGKYVPEGEAPKFQPAAPPAPAAAGINKTMLGETEAPIKYNCPRCKKPLESPASEALIKKPCPECGQRLQVPAAPAASSPAPAAGINKTMLASDEAIKSGANKTMLVTNDPPIYYNCPRCKKPLESPSIEAGTKKPCPECGQRFQVPTASTRDKTMLAGAASSTASSTVPSSQAPADASPISNRVLGLAGIGMVGLIFIVLLACVVPAVLRGGKSEDSQALAQAKAEFERIRAQLENDKKAWEKQKQYEDDQKMKWDRMMADHKAQQDALNVRLQLAMQNAENKQKAEEAKLRIEAEQRKLEQARQDAIDKQKRDDAELKTRLDALQAQIKTQNDRAQQAQTIIQQPPVVYYPPYHPGYYRPSWWW